MVSKVQKRKNRAERVRSKLGVHMDGKLRLSVFKSSKHFYVQLIDDALGKTLVHASTLSPDIKEKISQDRANRGAIVGKFFVDKCGEYIERQVVFDRGGYAYTGLISSFVGAVRDLGLKV